MAFLSIGLVQVFAGPNNTAAKTKISTVDWNMQRKGSDSLYWFKFAFLDKSTASGTIQEICSNDFRKLKSDMKMQGYFYSLMVLGSCPKGEVSGMGVIFRGDEISRFAKTFSNQKASDLTYGKGATGMLCVKHAYLGKSISTCTTHLDYVATDKKFHIWNNVIGGDQLQEYIKRSNYFGDTYGGSQWKSDVTFASGDFNHFAKDVKAKVPGYKSLVNSNTHDALKAGGPTYQLDYIMVSNSISKFGESFKPSCNLGSDHCMIGGYVWV